MKEIRAINGYKRPFPINVVTLALTALNDPARAESTNNGNYRDYRQFAWDVPSGLYAIRDFSSFHGDIEPYPGWDEGVQITEFFRCLREAAEIDARVAVEEEAAREEDYQRYLATLCGRDARVTAEEGDEEGIPVWQVLKSAQREEGEDELSFSLRLCEMLSIKGEE